MWKIILTNLPVFLIGISFVTFVTAGLSFWMVINTNNLMTTTLLDEDVKDIITRHHNNKLAELDDVTLANAADKLEIAYRHYFDHLPIGQMQLDEFHLAQLQQRELRQIADSIWRLLSTRYGCND